MTIDRKELIELYKLTLEQGRHHNTMRMQMFMAAGVVSTLLLAAIGYFFNKDFPLSQQYVGWVKAGILVFFAVMECFFLRAFCRNSGCFTVCNCVSKNIEEKIKDGKKTIGKSEFEGLLIDNKLRELGKKCEVCKCYREVGLYFEAAILFLAGLAFLLFCAIN